MSIENTLERIAVALEAIAASKQGVNALQEPNKVSEAILKRGLKAAASAVQPPPGVQTATVVKTEPVVTTPEELRTLAQKMAQKMGSNTLPFVEFVKSVLAPLGVDNLTEVPLDQINNVALRLKEYANKAGI